MSVIERQSQPEDVGVRVETVYSLMLPDNRYVLTLEDKQGSGSASAVPVGEVNRLRDMTYWQRAGFSPRNGSSLLLGSVRGDKLFDFAEGLKDPSKRHSKQIIPNKLLTPLKPFERVSSADFRTKTRGIVIEKEVKGNEGIIFREIKDCRFSPSALVALLKADALGESIVLATRSEIERGRVGDLKIDPACLLLLKENDLQMPGQMDVLAALIIDLARRIGFGNHVQEDLQALISGQLEIVSYIERLQIPHFLETVRSDVSTILSTIEGRGPGGVHRLIKSDYQMLRRLLNAEQVDGLEAEITALRFTNFVNQILAGVAESGSVAINIGQTRGVIDENSQLFMLAGIVGAEVMGIIIGKKAKSMMTRGLGEILDEIVVKYRLEAKLLAQNGVIMPRNLDAWARDQVAGIADAEQYLPPLVEMGFSTLLIFATLVRNGEYERALGVAAFFLACQGLMYFALKIRGPRLPEDSIHAIAAVLRFWPIPFGIKAVNQFRPLDILSFAPIAAHASKTLDGVEENREGTESRLNLFETLGKFNRTIGASDILWTRHATRIILDENIHLRNEDGSERRYQELDDVEKQNLVQRIPFVLFDNYAVTYSTGAKLIQNGRLILEGGVVNEMELPRFRERAICLASLGENIEHDGSILVRESSRDFNGHERKGLVEYFPITYSEMSGNPFFGVPINRIFHFLRTHIPDFTGVAIDNSVRVYRIKDRLAELFLEYTDLFSPEELRQWREREEISYSMSRRVQIARIFLSDAKVVVIQDPFDLTEVDIFDLEKESDNLNKVARFLAREAKKGRIILIGSDGTHTGYRDIFREENALGSVYTISEDKQFEKINV